MKKLILLFSLVTIFSCKTDNGEVFTGDFVYYKDAAVLQTEQEIHGVVVNKKMKELADQAKAFQKEPTDMVKVEVSGILIPKDTTEEGWPFKLDIKKIISVKALDPKESQVIKIGQ